MHNDYCFTQVDKIPLIHINILSIIIYTSIEYVLEVANSRNIIPRKKN